MRKSVLKLHCLLEFSSFLWKDGPAFERDISILHVFQSFVKDLYMHPCKHHLCQTVISTTI